MEGKKISFGFVKTKKVEKLPIVEKKEYIECVEEKSIKVIGGEVIQENTPLVIPMKPNTLKTAERLKYIAEKVESALDEPELSEIKKPCTVKGLENETIEQMAVRELMEAAKKEIKVVTSSLTVAISSNPVNEGEKESNLDDYEAVPVQEFGMAMLRGMGWTKDKELAKYKQPELRPKGLGLGADKVIRENQKRKNTKDGKNEVELTLIKNSLVKITTGKFSGYYGKVVSLDDDNGRVVVDIPIKKETVSLSEFMMFPVTKAEYDKESKVINAGTFEQYKKSENGPQKHSKSNDKGNTSKASENQTYTSKDRLEDRRENSNYEPFNSKKERERQRKKSSSSEDLSDYRHKREKEKYYSSESLSSSSSYDRRPKKKGNKHRRGSSESYESKKKENNGSMTQGKRDIDKKRKGKKKKRDRDRSPNYKKYKK